jgi:hypothetical protein
VAPSPASWGTSGQFGSQEWPDRLRCRSTDASYERLVPGRPGPAGRAAGTAQRLDWRVRLQLESDSDSPGGKDVRWCPVASSRGSRRFPVATFCRPARRTARRRTSTADGWAPQVQTCIYMVHVMLLHYMYHDPSPIKLVY